MDWLQRLAAIEELEDAPLDAGLVAEFERAGAAAAGREIRFSTPTFKAYSSCDVEGCGKNAEGVSDPVLPCPRCGGRLTTRADDNEAVVRERLKVYQRNTEPLLAYYATRPTFRSVNGAQPPEQVAAALTAAVDAASAHAGGAIR